MAGLRVLKAIVVLLKRDLAGLGSLCSALGSAASFLYVTHRAHGSSLLPEPQVLHLVLIPALFFTKLTHSWAF